MHVFRLTRCTKYDSIPSTCTMIPDPKDPQCCQVPQCIQVPSLTPGPGATPTVITDVPTGRVTGVGLIPTPTPDVNGHTPVPTSKLLVLFVSWYTNTPVPTSKLLVLFVCWYTNTPVPTSKLLVLFVSWYFVQWRGQFVGFETFLV